MTPPAPATLPARFTDKMFVFGECWLWMGAKQGKGYGCFCWGGRSKSVLAHRFAYEVLVGPVPEGLTIDHACLNKLCVKAIADEHGPAHLEVVTRSENSRRHWVALTGPARDRSLSGLLHQVTSGPDQTRTARMSHGTGSRSF